MKPNFNASIRGDSDNEVKSLFREAQKRKENAIRFKLLADLLDGKTIDLTKSSQLFEAVNREKMDFEQILKLHPKEAQEQMEYVKQRKSEQGGRWYNPQSQAWWGEKGVIPPCCYHARPRSYWKNQKLVNNFFNTFPKFRIAESPL